VLFQCGIPAYNNINGKRDITGERCFSSLLREVITAPEFGVSRQTHTVDDGDLDKTQNGGSKNKIEVKLHFLTFSR